MNEVYFGKYADLNRTGFAKRRFAIIINDLIHRGACAFAALSRIKHNPALGCVTFLAGLTANLLGAETHLDLASESPHSSLWESAVGEGFSSTAKFISVSAGANCGFAAFGGTQEHDLALVSVSYDRMLSHVMGKGHWYRGNAEFRLELFTGAEFSPDSQWLVGLTPHLRYNFATGTRWVPFVDAGAGVTATGIGPPDLSNTFEFNLQLGGGVRWFLRDNLALTLEAHLLHFSCAGISSPNLGLNGMTGTVGVSFFF